MKTRRFTLYKRKATKKFLRGWVMMVSQQRVVIYAPISTADIGPSAAEVRGRRVLMASRGATMQERTYSKRNGYSYEDS